MNICQRMEPVRLIWLVPGQLDRALDQATWLEPTRLLRRHGLQVRLIDFGPGGTHKIDGVEVWSIPAPHVYLLGQIVFHLRALGLILRQWNVLDIVFFHQLSALYIFPLRLLRFVRRDQKPILVMDTRTLPMESKDKATLKDRLRGTFANLMNHMANVLADGQTAITPAMANAVNIPRNKLWGTWPSGVCPEQFALAEGRRHWPSEEEPVYLIYIGVLHYERNLMALAQAVTAANAQGMNLRLSLVGDGTERAALEDFACASSGSVSVLPPVPHSEVPALLAEAHVGVLPFPNRLNYRVSSPLKLFEYMAAGLAIMATRITCHTDVIDNGSYVFWARDGSVEELTAALDLVWRSRASLAQMGHKAASASESWTWQAAATKLRIALEYGLA